MVANCLAGKGREFQSPALFSKIPLLSYLMKQRQVIDVENETLIQAALSRLIKDKTVLVIAHRMRTVSGADKVVVLLNGTVAEQGTPEKLMNTGKIYPHMVKLQMISQDWGI